MKPSESDELLTELDGEDATQISSINTRVLPRKIAVEFIRSACYALEFVGRLALVNVPLFLLGKSPELDRISSCVMAYLIFQVVALCWAFLVNAAFALACRVPFFLPPLDLVIESSMSNLTQSSGTSNSTDWNSLLSSPSTSVQLIAAFYVSYASIRVVVNFAQSLFYVALESIKDFPEASAELSKGGIFTLQLFPIVFIPALVLEIGLISADTLCLVSSNKSDEKYSDVSYVNAFVCRNSGLGYITSTFPEVRRVILYGVLAMAVQLWQVLLHQFPKWDLAFRCLSTTTRAVAQISVLILSIISIIVGIFLVFKQVNVRLLEILVCSVVMGWTMWLFAVSRLLVATHGESWAARTTTQSLMHLAAYLRLSHVCILALTFGAVCFTTGFLQAQLDITLATIFIPALYSCFYLIAAACIRAGPSLLTAGIPIALVLAVYISHYLAKSGGRGGVILVFLHIFGKIIHFFAEEDIRSGDEMDDWMTESDNASTAPSEGLSVSDVVGYSSFTMSEADYLRGAGSFVRPTIPFDESLSNNSYDNVESSIEQELVENKRMTRANRKKVLVESNAVYSVKSNTLQQQSATNYTVTATAKEVRFMI